MNKIPKFPSRISVLEPRTPREQMQKMMILREYGDFRDARGISINDKLPAPHELFSILRFAMFHSEKPVSATKLRIPQTGQNLSLAPHRPTAGLGIWRQTVRAVAAWPPIQTSDPQVETRLQKEPCLVRLS